MSKRTVKVPKDMTQAELFGVDELNKVTKDKHGVGRLPDPWPDGSMMVYSEGKWRFTAQDAFDRFCAKVAHDGEGMYKHPGAYPLPWHIDMNSAEVPFICDANNVEIVRFAWDADDERNWANAELIVACVNKLAASISDEQIAQMRDTLVCH